MAWLEERKHLIGMLCLGAENSKIPSDFFYT